ncbi:BACON domain-containing protein [Paraflavisolibacter sp. H34]|uniref:BACON domain-containing protein n=1 Tax=Huijunlia imazamoxiresistens TaxID=3127457 RepID=UPI00301ABDB1
MKRFFCLLTPVLLLVAYACQKPADGHQTAPELTLDSAAVALPGQLGAQASFTLHANIEWVASDTVSWLRLDKVSGSGNTTIQVTALENNFSSAARTATISIRPVGYPSVAPLSITIRQGSGLMATLWSRLLGSAAADVPGAVIETEDHNFLLAGYASAGGGDVTGFRGASDFWLAKVSAGGELLWQKTLGGTGADQATALAAIPAGGYLLAGTTASINGDVTNPHGGTDAWVVKVDASGNKLWQKALGGAGYDGLYAVVPTADGGFLLAGETGSNDGDVSGNHGGTDAWVVKLDASGARLWQKTFGGSGADKARSLKATTDGGYILVGETASSDGDVSGQHGKVDAWVLKLDASGNKVWQKTLGGSGHDYAQSLTAVTGGYLLAGFTNSADGDVTANKGNYDVWVVKLDESGRLLWQKTYGGTGGDLANAIAPVTGGFAVVGSTSSANGDVSASKGGGDAWLLKIDASGNRLGEKTWGGTGYESALSFLVTSGGKFLLGGTTDSKDGDITGSKGGGDIWLWQVQP